MTARLAFGLLGEVTGLYRVSLLAGLAGLAYAWVAFPRLVPHATAALVAWTLLGVFAWGQSYLVGPVPTLRVALPWAAVTALAGGWLVTKQYVFFATANMTQPWEKSLRWRAYWAAVARGRAMPGRPAVTSFRHAALPVVAGVAGSLALCRSPHPLTGTLLGYCLGLVATAGLLWPRGCSVEAAVRASASAVRVFLSYQPVPAVAPGVFRLPTRWLRRGAARLAVGVLALLPLAWAATDLPPVYTAPLKTVSRSVVYEGRSVRLPDITSEENDFLNEVSPADRDDYVRVLVARRAAEARWEASSRREYALGILSALLVGGLVPPAVFLLTLVTTAGPLLAAFHTAFEDGEDE